MSFYTVFLMFLPKFWRNRQCAMHDVKTKKTIIYITPAVKTREHIYIKYILYIFFI